MFSEAGFLQAGHFREWSGQPAKWSGAVELTDPLGAVIVDGVVLSLASWP